ncbi:two-component sensor histidine kinase [Bacillus sp. FJAT-29790]|uniref:sensor histidine kinase n=1 Tax=Bacillus sp. FJAT-29790 TaxID=1895002 RepID=UPI001C23EB41|nr:ATP-binding protein [Bacillus sp. FJAT-29790]MBU8878942.1 two-component sensor histidine kinase [Bacillus sp. FJAT-29790]
MKDQIKNLPLFRKVLLFSFLISLIVVFSAAGISLLLQTQKMEEQLRNRVVEIASLWSSTINVEDIVIVKENRDSRHPAFQKIFEKISVVNEKAPYTNAFLLFPKASADGEILILVSSNSYENMGMESFSYYHADETFLKGFDEALVKKQVTSSSLYRGQYGLWISAFSPIMDQKGNVAAILIFDINAVIIESFQKDIAIYLVGFFLIMLSLVYVILNRGLKKVLNPVNEIISGFNEVSNGNFNIRLQSSSQPDLGILFERFNNMTNQLSLLFERLSATSEQFGTGNRSVVPRHRFEEAIDEMEQIFQKTKLQRELQRAEKMNAIGQLAASVAHEIRNPMTVVKGFLQIFLAKEHMSDEERMYIRLMIEEMKRAETIINDYLSLAKPDIEQTEIIDAGEVASKVLDLMNSYAMMSKNILLESDLNRSVYIKGNTSELKQVLINILKNGIEAMKDGGTLSLYVYKEGPYGVIQIGDTGIGMSQDQLERLGTAFYSLKEKGTGIGMMVCYQIIDRMKGRIEVQSKNGKGTIFRIYVPLMED